MHQQTHFRCLHRVLEMLIILFQATPAPPDLPEDETQAHPQDLHTDQNQDKESLSRIALPILFNPGYNMVIVDYL